MLETLSEIHSCIALIEQAAGLPFNLPAEIGDLTFQLCNMGGELVSVEGLSDSLGNQLTQASSTKLACMPLKLGSATSSHIRNRAMRVYWVMGQT